MLIEIHGAGGEDVAAHNSLSKDRICTPDSNTYIPCYLESGH